MDEKFQIENRFLSLDGIRGLAFLMVFTSHLFAKEFEMTFLIFGKLGVWLFFVLSSFLLCNYFFSRPERAAKVSEWLTYFVRRFLRIYPLYAAVLFLYLLDQYYIQTEKELIGHLLLKGSYGHFWTIPVELKFYFFLPLIVLGFIHAFRLNWIAAISGVTLISFAHQHLFPANQSEVGSIDLYIYIPIFLFGAAAALTHTKLSQMKLSPRFRALLDVASISTLVLIVGCVPAIWSALFSPIPAYYYDRKFIYFGLLFSIFLVSVLHGSGFVKKIFEFKILRYIGTISYSGYLIHPLILHNFREVIPEVSFSSVFLVTAATLFSASCLHEIFEKPFLKISPRQK